jgi:hypothetical protein
MVAGCSLLHWGIYPLLRDGTKCLILSGMGFVPFGFDLKRPSTTATTPTQSSIASGHNLRAPSQGCMHRRGRLLENSIAISPLWGTDRNRRVGGFAGCV